jgi:uncharacterized protein (DUF2141 family)
MKTKKINDSLTLVINYIINTHNTLVAARYTSAAGYPRWRKPRQLRAHTYAEIKIKIIIKSKSLLNTFKSLQRILKPRVDMK